MLLSFSFLLEDQWELAIWYLMVIHCYFLPIAVSYVNKLLVFHLHSFLFLLMMERDWLKL